MFASKKQLAVFLSKLRAFDQPNPALEQYPTDSEVAATILWNAYMENDITGKSVLDLGCGTGVLGIGALVLGAKHVTFVEIDDHVLPQLMANLSYAEEALEQTYPNYDIAQKDALQYNEAADVVLQNPPFGTRNAGVDVQFLEKAMALAPTVYSMHKTVTEEHIKNVVTRNNRTVAATFRFAFPLKQTMAQHKRKIQRIEVSCIKVMQDRAT